MNRNTGNQRRIYASTVRAGKLNLGQIFHKAGYRWQVLNADLLMADTLVIHPAGSPPGRMDYQVHSKK